MLERSMGEREVSAAKREAVTSLPRPASEAVDVTMLVIAWCER